MSEKKIGKTKEIDRERMIKIIIRYIKKLNIYDLDRLLEYLNYLIAN